MSGRDPTYLGDGCYVAFDGYGFELTTLNGIDVTNRIFIDPDVYRQFVAFVERAGGPVIEHYRTKPAVTK